MIFAVSALLKDDERQIWTVRKGEVTRSFETDLTTSDPVRSQMSGKICASDRYCPVHGLVMVNEGASSMCDVNW